MAILRISKVQIRWIDKRTGRQRVPRRDGRRPEGQGRQTFSEPPKSSENCPAGRRLPLLHLRPAYALGVPEGLVSNGAFDHAHPRVGPAVLGQLGHGVVDPLRFFGARL